MGLKRTRQLDLLDPRERRGVELGFARPTSGRVRLAPRPDEREPQGTPERRRRALGRLRRGRASAIARKTNGKPRPGAGGKRPSRRIAGVLIPIAVVVAWFFLLAPRFMGGPCSYVMVSGTSMEPSLSTGDLVVARRQAGYEVGDVVAYRIPEGEVGEGKVVIHRIIGGDADLGYVLQGDNRDTPDLWRPLPDAIAGKLWFVIPGAGRLAAVLRTPLVFALIAAMIAVSVVLGRRQDTVSATPDESPQTRVPHPEGQGPQLDPERRS